MTETARHHPTTGQSVKLEAPQPLFSGLVFAACRNALRGLRKGSVQLSLPNGRGGQFAAPEPGASAVIDLNNAGILFKSLTRGTIGFAESYIAGDWTTSNLAEVFRFFVDNKSALVDGSRGWFRVRTPDRLFHRSRQNTKAGSQRNISFHYDLGNDFYRHWLDEGMTYSSAIFDGMDQSLEEAQALKYARVLEALDAKPGARLLELGCGWGGFAETAARRAGHYVHGVTLSREQLTYARARLDRMGLRDCADLELKDYRDTSGLYDGIVSIEMFEAVGREQWSDYFSILRKRIKPGARAVIQTITISEELYPSYVRSPDFIQRYIFPGGMLATKLALYEEISKAGLELIRVENFGESYARTLWAWRDRFLANWHKITELGFDERFRRMWDYYLTYCAVGFEKHTIDVGIYVVRHEDGV